MDVTRRAAQHAGLGDERRLLIVDHLVAGDRTVRELSALSHMSGNLLAHHLDVLETAGLIERRVSEGDHRRRYVSLRRDQFPVPFFRPRLEGSVAFVCTHNSARSQFAAALWRQTTGTRVFSAGTHPANRVDPKAIRVAAEFGIDLSNTRPSGYETLPPDTQVIISVCDRANEAGLPLVTERFHWSVPDPVRIGTLKAFRSAFGDIAQRVDQLTSPS